MCPPVDPFSTHQPDDAGLQPERTGLAWNRTFVVLAATIGMLALQAFRDGVHIAIVATLGLLAALVLTSSTRISLRRSHRARLAFANPTAREAPTPLLALAAAAALLALASLALILLRG